MDVRYGLIWLRMYDMGGNEKSENGSESFRGAERVEIAWSLV